MPDLSDLLRQSVTGAAATYEPSPGLPHRIARRTLQLQRRRRGRIVGGVAVLAVAVLAVPVALPSRGRSNSVGVAYEPVNITAREVRVTTTTTTTTTAPIGVLDFQAFIDFGIQERNEALKKLAVALRKRDRDETTKQRAASEVLGALAARGASRDNNAPSGGPSGPAGTTGTTDAPSSSTTKKPSTTTTDPPTTTTDPPPPTTPTTPTTQPTAPIVPLSIVAPAYVCAGVPAVFVATGTGADLVVWSNQQVGALGIFTLTESTTILARLELSPGSVSSQAYGVQVTPAGTPPC